MACQLYAGECGKFVEEIDDPLEWRLTLWLGGEESVCLGLGGVVEDPPPAPRDERVWAGHMLGQPAPWSARPRMMDLRGFFRGLSLHDAAASNHAVPAWAQFLLFGKRSGWGRIWMPIGAWRRHPSGRAPLALALQRPPSPLPLTATTIVGSEFAPAAAAFKLLS
jgi:hypothetical protein